MSKVIVSGGFDPCHSGHIQMIREAEQLGEVVILLNSDAWLTRKKGKPFMTYDERFAIMSNIKGVCLVTDMNDDDGTACDGIKKVREMFPTEELYFANGGDRKFNSTPSKEQSLCNELDIQCVFGIGGDYKKNSSSVILSDWAKQTEQRPWGEFSTYEVGNYIGGQYKVKTLKVNPRQRLSLQYHNQRAEVWVIASGVAMVEIDGVATQHTIGDMINIPKGSRHRVTCIGDDPCVIMELQYGEMCDENDIVRLVDDYARNA
jgi:mannose-6-phosphate isomerase